MIKSLLTIILILLDCHRVVVTFILPCTDNLLSGPVLCHVYITMNSYLSVRVHVGVVAQELLQVVAERMDVHVGELVLVAVTYPGGE